MPRADTQVARVLRERVASQAAQIRAMSAVQLELAEANDAYRQVLASIRREADAAKGRFLSADVVLKLIDRIKESL